MPTHKSQDPEWSDSGDRIAKVIARSGYCSRRDAEKLIEQGRVSVNGQALEKPSIKIGPADAVTIDGHPLPARDRTRLWCFHKPKGVITTTKDPQGRKSVFDVLPAELPRVVSVGRLDINTEGLLLLTNDGGLARILELPATGWLRRYRVRAHGRIAQADIDALGSGIAIEGIIYGPIEGSVDRVQGGNTWMTLALREGKNREVKKILDHLGVAVNRLIRISYGPFQLGELETNQVSEIKARVLKEQLGRRLISQSGADFSEPKATRNEVAGGWRRRSKGKPTQHANRRRKP